MLVDVFRVRFSGAEVLGPEPRGVDRAEGRGGIAFAKVFDSQHQVGLAMEAASLGGALVGKDLEPVQALGGFPVPAFRQEGLRVEHAEDVVVRGLGTVALGCFEREGC